MTMTANEYDPYNEVLYGRSFRHVFDAETDDPITLVQRTSVYYGDNYFQKSFEKFFQLCFEFADSTRTKVLFYVLKEKKRRAGRYIGTPDQIAKGAGVSRAAAFEALREMEEFDFVRRSQNGVYCINPSLVSDVDELARRRLIKAYEELPKREKTKSDNKKGAE